MAGSTVFTEHGDAVGVRVRQWSQQHRVDDAEDGGVCADAERESEDGDDCEARIFPEHAQRETNVLHRLLHPQGLHWMDESGTARREAGKERRRRVRLWRERDNGDETECVRLTKLTKGEAKIAHPVIPLAMPPSDRRAWRAAPATSRR